MTPEQKAAYINAQSVAANCKLQGMIAANQQNLFEGGGVYYTEDHFQNIAEEFGLHHNQVMQFFTE